MQALHNHYQGEGNASPRIATTEKLKETLHYKSERSLTFTPFLDRMQKMSLSKNLLDNLSNR